MEMKPRNIFLLFRERFSLVKYEEALEEGSNTMLCGIEHSRNTRERLIKGRYGPK